jgi:LemA protein
MAVDMVHVLIIVFCAAVLVSLWVILSYNSFIKKKLKVENNFSQIKVQCKKRFDLIPNLVETVKGYASHEKETLEKVIAARSMGDSAKTAKELAKADNGLTQALSRLFALGESYPDLKANTNFLMLQNELSDIEKTIAATRGFYNDSVMMYNKAIMVFPNNIVAKMLGFAKADFFDAPEEEIQNVKVSFS